MKPKSVATISLLLAALATLGFLVIGLHELDYAGGHPGHYGPAKIIAWSAFAGAALGLSVCLLTYSATRSVGT